MEIEADLFQRLVNAGAIDSLQAQNITDYQHGNPAEGVILDKQTTTQLENGLIAARYLEHAVQLMDRHKVSTKGVDVSKLQQMKETNTAPAKLFNWNIILKEVEKLGIAVDSDSKGLIIAGDLDMISDLLKRIAELAGDKHAVLPPDAKQDKKSSLRKKRVKEGVDILSMDPNKKPNKCDSSLEIILNTLCRNFKMKPKQCAALLTNNNQYLMHSVVKGLKGNFEPVITWYEELSSIAEYFAEIICLESKKNKKHNTLIMSMNAIKLGVYSHSYEVAQWCLRLITKLAYEFEDSICTDALYEWVSQRYS